MRRPRQCAAALALLTWLAVAGVSPAECGEQQEFVVDAAQEEGSLVAPGQAEGELWSSVERIPGMRTPCFRTPVGERCVPIFHLAGLPKAGTSALWVKLGANPLFEQLPGKEYCLPVPEDEELTPQALWSWAENFPSPEELGPDRVLLSGCIDFFKEVGEDRYFDVLERRLNVSDYRVAVLFRDYPEYLFASYQYWCSEEQYMDQDCNVTDGSHVHPWHDRSPEYFHKVLMGEVGSPIPYQYGSEHWLSLRSVAEGLQARAGERLLVLSQHDLLDAPLETLRRVEAHWGVPPFAWPHEVLGQVVNHHSDPGYDRVAAGTHRPGQYADVAPMLPESLDYLKRVWHGDCQYFREEWKLCFASCCERGEARLYHRHKEHRRRWRQLR